jgi:hypothetical protein
MQVIALGFHDPDHKPLILAAIGFTIGFAATATADFIRPTLAEKSKRVKRAGAYVGGSTTGSRRRSALRSKFQSEPLRSKFQSEPALKKTRRAEIDRRLYLQGIFSALCVGWTDTVFSIRVIASV